MEETCQKCGAFSEGQIYTFHYGELSDTHTTNADFILVEMSSTKKIYKILGEESVFICNKCATAKLGWKSTIGSLLLALTLFVLGIMVLKDQYSESVMAWMPVIFCLCPGLLLFLAFVIGIFELLGKVIINPNKNTGEMAAIEVRKKDLGAHRVFWKSKEYSKLKRIILN